MLASAEVKSAAAIRLRDFAVKLRSRDLLPLAVLWAIAVFHATQYWEQEVDDAYITFRYARNVAELNGFVYNVGERVEGTSAFLFTLLLAAGIKAGLTPLFFARILGVASLLGTVTLVYRLFRRSTGALGAQLLAFGMGWWVASSQTLAFHSTYGLETLFFTFLLTGGVCGFLGVACESRYSSQWALWFGLASITRPEGFAFFLVFVGLAVAFRSARHWSESRNASQVASRVARELGWTIGVYAAVFAPVLIFRLAYFGAWLPNTVTAKSGYLERLMALPLDRLWVKVIGRQGFEKLSGYFGSSVGQLWPLAVAAFVTSRFRLAAISTLSVVFGFCALSIWGAGGWMDHHRLQTPMGPFVIIAIGLGLASLMGLAGRGRTNEVLARVVVVVVVVYGVSLQAPRNLWEWRTPDPLNLEPTNTLGHQLRELALEDDVVATDIAGRVPYFSGLVTIDTYGLCDREIALKGTRAGRFGKNYWPAVARRKPTILYFNGNTEFLKMYRHESFAELKSDFVMVKNFWRRTKRPKLLLFRKDRPNLDAVERMFGEVRRRGAQVR